MQQKSIGLNEDNIATLVFTAFQNWILNGMVFAFK
jgi:hypothetical protein